MSQDKNLIDKIDDYLFEIMNEEERQTFEDTLKTDKELAEAVALQKVEHRAMQLIIQKDLKANMNEWKKEKFASEDSSEKVTAKVIPMGERRSRRKFFQLASAAVVTLLFGFFFGNQWVNQNYGSQALAESSFISTSSNSRSNGNDNSNLPAPFQEALSAMMKDDYTQAIQLLAEINNPEFQETAKLLQAECYFKLKNYNQSIQICNSIINTSQDSSNKEKSEWYLTLSYLASENTGNGNQMLNQILSNPNHAYYPYVKKMKMQLDSFWGGLAN